MVAIIPRGGLGNCLFQYSAVMAHAWRNGFKYAIPLQNENPHYVGQKPYVFSGVNYCEEIPNLPKYDEPHFHYEPIPPKDNIILNGYFQSFHYSEDFREEILKAFGFKWKHEAGWCAIHVRRGDYMTLPDHHPFVGEAYLTRAVFEMNKLTGIKRFKIFSNDMPWCKEFFSIMPQFTFVFVEGGSELQDMEQGSWCSTQIMSNGTFALWQYYLNQNPDKICIAPKRWFGKLLPHNTDDLYPAGSILI